MPVTPTQCLLWKLDELTPEAVKRAFAIVDEYLDDSHQIRRLCRCIECGQLFFYEFYEEIDWAAGNDPQYRIYIPVADEAEAARLSALSRPELLALAPRINMDFPSDADTPRVYWVRANNACGSGAG